MPTPSLAGGDGSPENAILGLLGAVVGFGAMYNAVVTFRAFWGIPDWAWWLMWVPAAAGLLGILVGRHELAGNEPSSVLDWLVPGRQTGHGRDADKRDEKSENQERGGHDA